MRIVQRDELLENTKYWKIRDEERRKIIIEKRKRRVNLGENLTFLFENNKTIKYQIQEMLAIEGATSDDAIEHELSTYNDLISGPSTLGCTLLVHYDDQDFQKKQLSNLLDLPKTIYVEFVDGSRSFATYDCNQCDDIKLSAVQFLKFKCSISPIRLGCLHPLINKVIDFNNETRLSLEEDFKEN